ncbi:DMP19 family protein [Chryseobacterium flavum]|uniref:DMP19 family protein n=1 Tax=Chryseobacterium flavum TaxID=415851 RepID=UPI003F499C80
MKIIRNSTGILITWKEKQDMSLIVIILLWINREKLKISYYLDYYTSQYRNGNFSQFVRNSGWSAELKGIIKEGKKNQYTKAS